MKRQIVIEINAEDKTCGECDLGTWDRHRQEYYCDTFHARLGRKGERHPECLAAEQKAKEEAHE